MVKLKICDWRTFVYIKMNRIEKEKIIVEKMIRLYCHRKEGNKDLCIECQKLLVYAKKRLDRCHFQNEKTTCNQCPIHCYSPEMKHRIKNIMRWAGPRMLVFYPIVAIKHILQEL